MHPSLLVKSSHKKYYTTEYDTLPLIDEGPHLTTSIKTFQLPPCGYIRALLFVVFCLTATAILVFILTADSGVWCINLEKSSSYEVEPLKLVNRSAWDARDPKATAKFPKPPADYVIIIHTASQSCSSLKDCSREVRIIQDRQMDVLGYDDIAYNFLVGGDGQTYEGRGWDFQGANAKQFNNRSLGIAFIGYFQNFSPPTNQLEEAKVLISESVNKGKLSPNYKLVGHRQVSETLSPGDALYDIIKRWPHWEHCYMSSCEQ